jgi:hypothetical protein
MFGRLFNKVKKEKEPKVNKFTGLFDNDNIVNLLEQHCLQETEEGWITVLQYVDLSKMIFVDTTGGEFSVNPPLSTFLTVLCKIFHTEDFNLFIQEVDGDFHFKYMQYCLRHKGVFFLELNNTTLKFKKGFDVFTTFEQNVIKAVFLHKIRKIGDYEYNQKREAADRDLNEMLKEVK